MKLVIKGEKILAVGAEIVQNGNSIRITKTNGEIGGMSANDVQIVELDISEDLDVKNYRYDAQTGTVVEKVKTFYTKNDFIELFAATEWRIFKNLIPTDDIINKFYDQIIVVDWIDLNDVRTQQAMGYCVNAGVISRDRFDEIFSGVQAVIEF